MESSGFKKRLLLLLFLTAFSYGCGGGNKENDTEATKEVKALLYNQIFYTVSTAGLRNTIQFHANGTFEENTSLPNGSFFGGLEVSYSINNYHISIDSDSNKACDLISSISSSIIFNCKENSQHAYTWVLWKTLSDALQNPANN